MAAEAVSQDDHIPEVHKSDKLFQEASKPVKTRLLDGHFVDGEHGNDNSEIRRKTTDNALPVTQCPKQPVQQQKHTSITLIDKLESICFFDRQPHDRPELIQ